MRVDEITALEMLEKRKEIIWEYIKIWIFKRQAKEVKSMKKKRKIKEWIKKSGVMEVKGIENFEEGNINNVKCSWKA